MAFVRDHRWGLTFAVGVGLCIMLPTLFTPLYIGGEYEGIQFAPLDDEEIYRARVHEVLDGHMSASSPFMYEYKSVAVAMPAVNEWFYALPALAIGLSAAIVVNKFILPAILFFLAYLLIRRITKDERTSIAGGLLVFFSVEFVDYGYMFSLLQGGWPRPLLWSRIVNPIVGAVELFAFLNLIWIVIDRSRKYAFIAAGIVLGMTVGYYFSLGIALAVLGVLFLIYAYRRNYVVAKELVLTGVVGLIVSTPYWYSVFSAIGGSREAAMRGGMFFTHMPVFNKALIAATIILFGAFVYAYWRRIVGEYAREWIFAWALIIAGWIAFNQQVITGREVWHHHFVQYVGPLSALAIIIAFHATVRTRLPRLWKWGMVGSVFVSCLFGLYSTLHVSPRLDTFRHHQSYGELFGWLQEKANKDCVVYVHEEVEALARFIPAYSSCNVYKTTSTFFGVPEERVLHNYLLDMQLKEVVPKDAATYLQAHESEVRGYFFEDWNQALMNTDPEWLDKKVTELAAQYREFSKTDLKSNLQKYRLDYIVSETPLAPAVVRALPGLEEVAKAGEWHIYAFDEE